MPKKNIKKIATRKELTPHDATFTLAQAKKMAHAFVHERDWTQFHSPKNVSMDITIEAAELMEKFCWIDVPASYKELQLNRREIEDETADIFFALMNFCNSADIDMSAAFVRKLKELDMRYPVDKVKSIAGYKAAKKNNQ